MTSSTTNTTTNDAAAAAAAAGGGETSLATLLHTMEPSLHSSHFHICTLPTPQTPSSLPAGLEIQALIRETEGWTVILPTPFSASSSSSSSSVDYFSMAEKLHELGLVYDKEAVFSMITLTVHSSLLAVGLTAAIARVLGGEGVSCNVVAGFYHDHIFVPVGDAGRAMRALERLAEGKD